MVSYRLPRYFLGYVWLLAVAMFLLSLKVPFAFAPPAAELWIVVNFVLESRHILIELLRYFGLIITIYSALAWWAYRFTLSAAYKNSFKPIVVYSLFALSLIWLLLTLLVANIAFHPLSGFDWLVPRLLRSTSPAYIAASMWMIFSLLHIKVAPPRHWLKLVTRVLLLILPAMWFAFGPIVAPLQAAVTASTNPEQQKNNSKKPNVILIGIDSFSPLHFKRYGDYIQPLWSEVEKTFVFSDTVATVPRTYPSWASILSGQYSITSGVRFNLMPRERHNHLDGMLQNRLKSIGYRTVFAMDERLFANFDETFGFDEVYGPPLGAADLALSGISDHPISNLIGHVPLVGKWLFPHTFSNRATAKTYWPDEFSSQLERGLAHNDGRPLFLVAHFCLSHWPYYWGERFGTPVFIDPETGEPAKIKGINKEPIHAAAVRRAGVQINEFMDFLKANGYLDNSIVVLLSDHGEGIKAGEKIKLNPATKNGPELTDNEFAILLNRTNASFNGHGVNVYDEWQTQVLLGFRGFGEQLNWIKPGITGRPASLIDVAPTVLDIIGSPYESKDFDGVSLVPDLRSGVEAVESGERFRIVETDLLIRAMVDINKISVADVVREGVNFYQVTDDGRVELKPKVIDEQMQSKIRSVYYRDWILSVSPPMQGLPCLYVLLNRESKKWTYDMSDDLAQSAPLMEMYQALRAHYGSEFPDHGTFPFLKKDALNAP